jgi:hypothetical protein
VSGPGEIVNASRPDAVLARDRTAKTLLLPKTLHKMFDANWEPVWEQLKASGTPIRAADVQRMLENAVDRLPAPTPTSYGMTESMKNVVKGQIRKELYTDLGLKPGTVIKPGSGPPMRVNLLR